MTGQAAVHAFEQRRRALLTRSRLASFVGLLAFSVLFLASLHVSEFFAGGYGDAPLERMGRFLARMNPQLSADVLFENSGVKGSLAYWFYNLGAWTRALLVSVEMAVVATAFGAVIAMLAAMLMARNVCAYAPVRAIVRRSLDLLRVFPDFILTLLFVQAFGAGPFAGVLAIMISTFASLARLFAEALENVDMRAAESVKAAGGGFFQKYRYGIWPNVAPNQISLSFIMLEANLSRSTTLGVVGGGGIGQELLRSLQLNQFDTYFALVLMIILVVMAGDLLSEYVRHRVFGVASVI
jgi:phosphonate transport system permease protein